MGCGSSSDKNVNQGIIEAVTKKPPAELPKNNVEVQKPVEKKTVIESQVEKPKSIDVIATQQISANVEGMQIQNFEREAQQREEALRVEQERLILIEEMNSAHNNDTLDIFAFEDEEFSCTELEMNFSPLIFYFDLSEKRFFYYDIEFKQWIFNDLKASQYIGQPSSLFKFNIEERIKDDDIIKSQFSCIAAIEKRVFIAGGHNSLLNFVEYNIKTNTFIARVNIPNTRKKPTLTRFGKYIYTISGDSLKEYTKTVERYSIEQNKWSTLPDLPFPQAFSSAKCLISTEDIYDKEGDTKKIKKIHLVVVGGYSTRNNKTQNYSINVFDFRYTTWQTIDLHDPQVNRIPKFVLSPVSQLAKDIIVILGSQESQQIFEVNIKTGLLQSTPGRLKIKDKFSNLFGSQEAFYSAGHIYCLSHDNDHKQKIHNGYLALNDWKLI